jgi:hypothetical protein
MGRAAIPLETALRSPAIVLPTLCFAVSLKYVA